MKDKDLLVVIAEMLRKQDQHSEILNLHTQILNQHTQILERTNETLVAFADVSIKQFEQQQVFNEKFLGRLDNMEKFNEQVLDLNKKMVDRLEAIEKKL
jgi:hypothetical protein